MIDGRDAVRALQAIDPVYMSVPGPICSLLMPGTSLIGYRMTITGYRRMLIEQEGVCAICGGCNYRNGEPWPLSVDHDHVCCRDRKRTCGRCVRGLLCASCNGWLGELELWGRGRVDETWELLALEYLAQRGCDPDAPYRRFRLREEHQGRWWNKGCRCKLCS